MSIKFLSSACSIKALDTQSITSMYSSVKNQFVSIVTSGSVLSGAALLNGSILGLFTVRAIDHSVSKKDFQNRWKYLIAVGITILTVTKSVLDSLFNESNTRSGNIFAALSLGVVIGIQIQEYYNKNSDQKINEFIKDKTSSRGGQVNGISLSGYRGCLNYFHLAKLGQKIHERFNADSNLKLLDLSDTELTDNNLREMAQTGFFNNVSSLVLKDNPYLTGKGIAWIAEKGFASLQELDLSSNGQVIKTGLNEWIERGGFKNLTSLNLACTGITENELERMIEKAEWFRRLKGLNLDWNEKLRKFPTNILELTNLDDHTVSNSQLLSGGPIYFYGEGIFCRGCKLTCTREILQLAMQGKVFGAVNNGISLNIKGAFKNRSLERIYKLYNVPFAGYES